MVFLETAELRAKNRNDITIRFWKENVDKIIQLNDKKLLKGAGKISNAEMEEKVRAIYAEFDEKRKKEDLYKADHEDFEELRLLEQQIKYNEGGV